MRDLSLLKTYMHHTGYLMVLVPDHPRAWAGSGLYLLHRLVVEESIGRYLEPREVVHHLDGNKLNNNISNLRLTNPTEHNHLHKPPRIAFCGICGKRLSKWCDRFCSPSCANIGRQKIVWPDPEELARLVFEFPVRLLAKTLGISDVAIQKRCKRLGIATPDRGYWSKLRAARDDKKRSLDRSQQHGPTVF